VLGVPADEPVRLVRVVAVTAPPGGVGESVGAVVAEDAAKSVLLNFTLVEEAVATARLACRAATPAVARTAEDAVGTGSGGAAREPPPNKAAVAATEPVRFAG